MAAKPGLGSQDFWRRFWPMLSYACGELCVIILLYVAALASYAATRVAHICGLKVPCILCTRLDHALHGKAWFSADLVCAAHRSEISSLAYCKSHDQLARSDGLCKTCLLACKVVGASEEVNSCSKSRSRRLCSCCSEIFKNTHNGRKHSETAYAVESWEATNPRSQVYASGNIVARAVPEQVPAKRQESHLERNYSVLEPSDGSLTNDVEGENSLENVKKQLELNKKSMAALYKELEEERSASAVAASQTMAMINRLQEEKAAMQMEALQYLRMMEEQADHDHGAIQNLHDLLTEREKELLDMDSELANFRRLLESEPFDGTRFDATGRMNNTTDDRNLAFEFMNGPDFVRSTMSHFEDEKAYILDSLSRLEENLGISTNRLSENHTRADVQYKENFQLDGPDKSTSDKQHEGHEISLLNTRLRALEADQEFLKQW
nr:unnamed protein product [Digitaria exilis]